MLDIQKWQSYYKKGKLQAYFFMNMDENVPSKILANEIQQYIKTAMHSSGKPAFLGYTGYDNNIGFLSLRRKSWFNAWNINPCYHIREIKTKNHLIILKWLDDIWLKNNMKTLSKCRNGESSSSDKKGLEVPSGEKAASPTDGSRQPG